MAASSARPLPQCPAQPSALSRVVRPSFAPLRFTPLRFTLALAAAVLLAGCDGGERGDLRPQTGTGMGTDAVAKAVPADGRPRTGGAALHGSDIVGWTGAELQGRFGPPMLTFAEPPAEVWRYSAARCVALFFLYPAGSNAGSGGAVVRHVEILPRTDAASPATGACLQQLGAGTV